MRFATNNEALKSMPDMVTIDGNEAAAHVAYKTNEVIAIYPITPASPMGEMAEESGRRCRASTYGVARQRLSKCKVRLGLLARCTAHLQSGAMTTTFTASQGLLLMIPNMYKIAGELSPMVLHVAAPVIGRPGLVHFW